MARRIVLLGGPGAGKGTQAKRLAETQHVPHISTGDIFREQVGKKTELGGRIEDYMNRGQLVPDALTCEVVAVRLAQPDCAEGYILDGFPRSMFQAENLDRLLGERGEALDIAISLEVSDGEIVKRLTSRRTCSTCGRIYNLVSDPPLREGLCDAEECDGAELTKREDDASEDTVRERLRVYHETTEPIIAYYEKQDLLRSIGGPDLGPDDIALKIEEILQATGVALSP